MTARPLTPRARARNARDEPTGNNPTHRRDADGAEDVERRVRKANLHTGKLRQHGLVRQGHRPLILLVFVAAIGGIPAAYAALAR